MRLLGRQTGEPGHKDCALPAAQSSDFVLTFDGKSDNFQGTGFAKHAKKSVWPSATSFPAIPGNQMILRRPRSASIDLEPSPHSRTSEEVEEVTSSTPARSAMASATRLSKECACSLPQPLKLNFTARRSSASLTKTGSPRASDDP